MYKINQTLTFDQGFAENGGVSVDGGAIPSVLAELELALFDSGSGSLANLDHVIRMLLAESSLLPLHARNVIAIHPRISRRAQLKFAQKPGQKL
jgi:hypothetical protein